MEREKWLSSSTENMQDTDSEGAPAFTTGDNGTPLSSFLGHWRAQVDQTRTPNRFSGALYGPETEDKGSPPETNGPFLSVLVRTQGTRPDCLREALTCLAAQACEDFEVLVLVHAEADRLQDVQELLGQFHPSFVGRVELVQVTGGNRGRPLNRGIEISRGSYLAFLDDDDHVTGDWVETFKQGQIRAPGRIIRSVTVVQRVERATDPNSLAPYLSRTGFEQVFTPNFDMGYHLYTNQSPICSFAVPKELIEAFRLRFDEDLLVTEDWDFLMRAAQVAGVSDTERVTSVYRRWVDGQGSAGAFDQQTWDAVRESVLAKLDQNPLLMPAGSASKIATLGNNDVGLQVLNLNLAYLRQELENQRSQVEVLRAEREMMLGRQPGLRRLAAFFKKGKGASG